MKYTKNKNIIDRFFTNNKNSVAILHDAEDAPTTNGELASISKKVALYLYHCTWIKRKKWKCWNSYENSKLALASIFGVLMLSKISKRLRLIGAI